MMGENLMTKRVLIKYGEKEHLEELAEGKIRFAPSQNYVKMEEELHKRPPAAQNSPDPNNGCALLIHFDKHGQVEFTEKVPADAMVCTLERFKFYLEQHGWIVARKEQLVERLMRF